MDPTKKLLLDLYRVALVDGKLSREEQIVLNNFCYKNNISVDDLMHISKTENEEEDPIAIIDKKNREKYLFEIARIIIADGVIREEEIYLFDKIASSLGIEENIDIIRDEIFRIIIDEFITNKQNELDRLKKTLKKELNLKIYNSTNVMSSPGQKGKMIPRSEHEKIVRELIEGYKKGYYTYPYKPRVRIFIIGVNNMNRDETKKILIKALKEHNIYAKEKDIRLCTGDYDKISKMYPRHRQSVINGEYDYLIYGPHPHSIKDKSGTLSWETYLGNTHTMIMGDHDKPLTKESLLTFAQTIATDWREKN